MWLIPARGVSSVGVFALESPGFPMLFSFCTKFFTSSVASVFLKIQSVRSARHQFWCVGAISRSACTILRGMGLSLYSSGAHDCRNFSMSGVCLRRIFVSVWVGLLLAVYVLFGDGLYVALSLYQHGRGIF